MLNQDVFPLPVRQKWESISHNDTKYSYDALDRLIRIDSHPSYKPSLTILSIAALQKPPSKKACKRLVTSSMTVKMKSVRSMRESSPHGTPHSRRRSSRGNEGPRLVIELKGIPYAPIHDLQGNVAMLAAPSEEPTFYRYSAFGEEKITGQPLNNPWRFSSKRTDDLTNLVYYGRRFYDPQFGRWLTPDPAGFTDGMNLYAFVHNDPLTHSDEYGLIDYGQHDRNWPKRSVFAAAAIHETGKQALDVETLLVQRRIMQSKGLIICLAGKHPPLQTGSNRSHFYSTEPKNCYTGHSPLTEPTLIIPGIARRSPADDIASIAAGRSRSSKGGYKAAKWGSSAFFRNGINTESLVLNFVESQKGLAKGTNLTPVRFFNTKTQLEVEQLLSKKFGPPRGMGPHNKSFYNLRTKRTFNLHKDPLHHNGRAHVDIRKRGLPSDYYDPFF